MKNESFKNVNKTRGCVCGQQSCLFQNKPDLKCLIHTLMIYTYFQVILSNVYIFIYIYFTQYIPYPGLGVKLMWGTFERYFGIRHHLSDTDTNPTKIFQNHSNLRCGNNMYTYNRPISYHIKIFQNQSILRSGNNMYTYNSIVT